MSLQFLINLVSGGSGDENLGEEITPPDNGENLNSEDSSINQESTNSSSPEKRPARTIPTQKSESFSLKTSLLRLAEILQVNWTQPLNSIEFIWDKHGETKLTSRYVESWGLNAATLGWTKFTISKIVNSGEILWSVFAIKKYRQSREEFEKFQTFCLKLKPFENQLKKSIFSLLSLF
jgi:hypothetical protein